MDLWLTVDKTVTASPFVSLFSCMCLYTWTVWTYLEFQFMTTVFMSMAARLSNLNDLKPEIKIQTEGHTLTPASSWHGLEDLEAFESAPSHSPSQSPARNPTPNWPETQYCLEIQVISTEDDKAIPLPSHTWQVPIVKDMALEGRTGLTEAIVTGPRWTVLFYGQQSLGEGLSLGEARDITFTLSGVIAWVGKQAQISAKPISLGEGRQLMAQAITEGHTEPRGPGYPCSISPTLMPFNFQNQDLSPWSANLLATAKWWEVPWLGPWAGQQEWGWVLQWGQNQGQRQ